MLTTNILAPVVVIFALKYKDNKIPASIMVTIIYSHIVMMELKLIVILQTIYSITSIESSI